MDIIDFIISLFLTPQMEIGTPVESVFWLPLAVGLAASAAGAAASASANRKNEKMLKAMGNENEQDYLREYYRGALDNEGSRAYLKKLDERLKRSDKAVDNALTAQGATHENALAAKQKNNEVYSDAVANLVESEQSRKDQVKSGYKSEKMGLAQAQMQQNSNNAATWSQVGQGIADAAMGVGNAYDWKNPWEK